MNEIKLYTCCVLCCFASLSTYVYIYISHGLDLLHNFINSINTVASFSLLISPPRQSTFLMFLFTSMEATFTPRLTLNQQTHTHFFHSTVSTLDISNNLLSTVNFYVTNACVLMTKFFSTMPPNFSKYFLARQCPFSDILHHFNKVKQIDRHKLLSHAPKQQHSNICLITKFSPKIDLFIQRTKSNYSILKNDGKIGGMFVQPPVYACRQPPNLRNPLIMITITDNEPECKKPCDKIRCKVWRHINTATNVLINHKTVNPCNRISDSANVVYYFIAKNTQKHYILEKLAVISDTDLIITNTLSDRKSFFRYHCISMQMITTLTISKFAFLRSISKILSTEN